MDAGAAARWALGLGAGVALGLLAARLRERRCAAAFSTADQQARHAAALRRDDARVLRIEEVFQPAGLKGRRALVLGASRGLGFALAQELVAAGAETICTVRSPSPELAALGAAVIADVDVRDNACGDKIADQLDKPVDIVITNAGYFYGPQEKLDKLNFDEELKMIDICAVGPLRVVSALFNRKLLRAGGKVALITSQAGSIAWREEQNPEGDNYGHHMSRAATNMMGRLLSFELKPKGVSVALLHPGFNRTDMTAKYAEIWDKEGAVDARVGAKRVLHEINRLKLCETGRFVNCEDGLDIPW